MAGTGPGRGDPRGGGVQRLRLGGHREAARGRDRAGAEALLARTRLALREAGVPASVGMATRDPASGLQAAWERADQAMYADKRSHEPAQPPSEII